MPQLPQAVLHAKLRAALPAGTTFSTGEEIHPAIASVPNLGDVRVYLWTLTSPETASRRPDEYKIQLILRGQAPGTRGKLDLSGPHATFMLGYSPDYGIFVAWEAALHPKFGYSTTVQAREDLLEAARRDGWSVAPPRPVRLGREVRVAISPGNLFRYMRFAQHADRAGYAAERREAFLLASMAGRDTAALLGGTQELGPLSKRLRRQVLVQRIERDARFSPLIKQQYAYSCAVCRTQLDVVEGAHIIPVSQEGSVDEIWNGVCLCANHHKLFDSNVFTINNNLTISVDGTIVQFLKDSDRARGLDEFLTRFDSAEIQRPLFFDPDPLNRQRMLDALARRRLTAAISASH